MLLVDSHEYLIWSYPSTKPHLSTEPEMAFLSITRCLPRRTRSIRLLDRERNEYTARTALTQGIGPAQEIDLFE
jgi:hypothetical protein